ncbi:hypothetical protein DFJ73DRAFT_825755 [Zopfochytrium polystomum]|nr:hypothetical protein DFJ73DRAFT_825755 [Zopfochytrium polystomum]
MASTFAATPTATRTALSVADLPQELLAHILTRLPSIADLSRFTAASRHLRCTFWSLNHSLKADILIRRHGVDAAVAESFSDLLRLPCAVTGVGGLGSLIASQDVAVEVGDPTSTGHGERAHQRRWPRDAGAAVLRSLLKAGCPVIPRAQQQSGHWNKGGRRDETALFWDACVRGDVELVKVFLDGLSAGGGSLTDDMDAAASEYQPLLRLGAALNAAALSGQVEVVGLLLERTRADSGFWQHPFDPERKVLPETFKMALMNSAELGWIRSFNLLWEEVLRVFPDIADCDVSALEEAVGDIIDCALGNRPRIMESFREFFKTRGIRWSDYAISDYSRLSFATTDCTIGNLPTLQKLLNIEDDSPRTDSDAWRHSALRKPSGALTFSHQAVLEAFRRYQSTKILERILSSYPSLLEERVTKPVLVGIIETGDFHALQLLFAKCEDHRLLLGRRDSSLRLACMKGELEIVVFLLEKGADPWSKNGEPFRHAVRGGHVDVLRRLLLKVGGPQAIRSVHVDCWRQLVAPNEPDSAGRKGQRATVRERRRQVDLRSMREFLDSEYPRSPP